MKNYGKFYNYQHPKLGRLNLLTLTAKENDAFKSHLVISPNINTKDKLVKQILDMLADNPLCNPFSYTKASFHNLEKSLETVELDSLVTHNNFKRTKYKPGFGLGTDAVQGMVKEVSEHNCTTIVGHSYKDAVPFYEALDFTIDEKTQLFTTPATNPKLVTYNKFELDPMLSDLATDIFNNR